MVALVLVSGAVYGQGTDDKTLLRTEQLAARLELNEAQKAALDKQLKAAKADKEAQREKMKAFREEMRREAFSARQAHEAELKEILTEEQWAAYEKLKAEQKAQAGKRMRGMRKAHGQKHRRADGGGN